MDSWDFFLHTHHVRDLVSNFAHSDPKFSLFLEIFQGFILLHILGPILSALLYVKRVISQTVFEFTLNMGFQH
jgi:hypothetical protein